MTVEHNLVDGLIEEKKQDCLLQMRRGESYLTVCEQWIICNQQSHSGVNKETITEERNKIGVEVKWRFRFELS